MALDPGKLRERVTIQQATERRNSLGETTLEWSTFSERWASVLGAGQLEVSITHRVRLRYVTGLTQQMRLIWRGRTLEVVSLLEHNNRSEHELICQETN